MTDDPLEGFLRAFTTPRGPEKAKGQLLAAAKAQAIAFGKAPMSPATKRSREEFRMPRRTTRTKPAEAVEPQEQDERRRDESFLGALEEQFGATPWWVISGALHAIMLLVFALTVISQAVEEEGENVIIQSNVTKMKPQEEEPPKIISEFDNKRTIDMEEQVEKPIIMQDPEISDHIETADELDFHTAKGEEDKISDLPLGGTGVIGTLGLGGGGAGKFGQRGGGGRKNLVARWGGSAASESAVAAALKWLADHQEADGHWDCAKYGGRMPRTGEPAPHDIGVSGLALLAFLGAGNSETSGTWKSTVGRGIGWMSSHQQANGAFILPNDKSDGSLYGHAIATLAMVENYGMSERSSARSSAQKAIDFLMSIQTPPGGWRYQSCPQESDSSVTGWVVMALKSAKTAEIAVDAKGFQGASRWYDTVSSADGYIGYQRPGFGSSAMTAVGMTSRVFMGWKPTEQSMAGGANILLQNLPTWGSPDFYLWYYATLAMFQMGGKYWDTWNAEMKDVLVKNQCKEAGDNKGSWDPIGGGGIGEGGRVMSTALGALSLEVYYRYLPLYR